MQLAEEITERRLALSLTARQVADMVGVPTSSVTRIENGQVSPSFAIVADIFGVLGVTLGATPADPLPKIAAFRAATSRIDVPDAIAAEASLWLDRWARSGLSRDTKHLAAVVGGMTALRDRPRLVDYGYTDWWNVANALDGSAVRWCVTGAVAANRIVPLTGDEWPVFYVDDVAAAAKIAQLEPAGPSYLGRRVSLAPFDGVSEQGMTTDPAGLPLADRWQVVLDCAAGIGRMPEQADALIDSMAGVAA